MSFRTASTYAGAAPGLHANFSFPALWHHTQNNILPPFMTPPKSDVHIHPAVEYVQQQHGLPSSAERWSVCNTMKQNCKSEAITLCMSKDISWTSDSMLPNKVIIWDMAAFSWLPHSFFFLYFDSILYFIYFTDLRYIVVNRFFVW